MTPEIWLITGIAIAANGAAVWVHPSTQFTTEASCVAAADEATIRLRADGMRVAMLCEPWEGSE